MTSRLSSSGLARGAARDPRRTLGLWGLVLAAAVAVILTILPGTLTAEYSFVGNPDSQVGRDLLAEKMDMPRKANEVVDRCSRRARRPTDPGFRRPSSTCRAGSPRWAPMSSTQSQVAFKGGSPEMISADGHTAIIPIVMAGDVPHAEDNIAKVHDIVHEADGRDGVTALITGTASISSDFGETADRDLRSGEGIGLPIALIILLIVFGTLIAAGAADRPQPDLDHGRRRPHRRTRQPDQRLGLRREHGQHDGPRGRHRLLAVHRLALPRGTARGPLGGRRRLGHVGHGVKGGLLQRHDGRPRTRRDADRADQRLREPRRSARSSSSRRRCSPR